MKWDKITALIVSLMIASVVAFNSLIQLAERLFLPEVKQGMIQALLFIMVIVIIYTIKNRKELLR